MNSPRLMCLTLGLAMLCPTIAQRAFADDTIMATPEEAAAEAQKARAPREKPEFPPFDDVMKDFKPIPSKTGDDCFLNLYHNKKTDELRAVIPANMIGKHFLVASSMSGGPSATGFQLDDFIAYFERMEKSLVLMQLDARYNDAKGSEVADVVGRSYRDAIVTQIPIITMQGPNFVISLDYCFKRDFGGLGSLGGGAINPGLSRWISTKPFPKNIELTVDAAFMGRGGGRRLPVHYSISELPKTSYKPRMADPRVGYFMTVRKDWGKKHGEDTLFDRYINRWNIEKRDPSLEKSPVKQPIVWYIEKTVPVRFRHAVKEGILEWNNAFEKIGYLDAIQVVQQEENNEHSDKDPEDVRYNFIRWIVTGRAFAMGPSRANPLTGEILDADIVFDDAMIRSYVTDYERYTGSPKASIENNPILDSFLENNPQWRFSTPWNNLMSGVTLRAETEEELFYKNLAARMAERGHHLCDYCNGMTQQIDMAAMAFAAGGKEKLPDEFLNQIIKEIVAHEVGHCLGLRHNFKASTWLSMEQIVGSDGDGTPNVGSVMDYNPITMPERDGHVGAYVTRSIGPYDFWAIEYGYKTVGAPFKSESEMLSSITSRSGEEGLQYATDEDTTGVVSPDPYSNRFDLGQDVIKYAERQIMLTNTLLGDALEWCVKDGESYSKLRRTFTRLAGERGRVAAFVARFVGGQEMSRSNKGDKNAKAPITPVPAARQREAVSFLVDNLFNTDWCNYSPDLVNHLAAGRQQHWDSDDFDFRQEFNLHDMVAGIQYGPLFTIMNPFTISRIHDNELKFADGEEAYTLAEHLRTVTAAIWSELEETGAYTDTKPMINSMRRNLQRTHLEMMLNFVLEEPGTSVPADCNSIARMLLTDMSKKITTVLGRGNIDTASRAHLLDVQRQIDRSLNADASIKGIAGLGGLLFLREPQAQEPVEILPRR